MTTAAASDRVTHLPTIELMGVRFHAVSEERCIAHILSSLGDDVGGWVVTPNLDILRRCTRDPDFEQLVQCADLVVADGMPLIWASRLQRTPLPERVAGSTLITTLSEAAAAKGARVFFLGGAPGTALAASEQLKQCFPSLVIAGSHCPPLGFEHDAHEMSTIQSLLQESRPDIVFVALGSPKQERFIHQMRDQIPAAWWLGIGISFSFIAGDVRRAPLWMQRAGLEWSHRLLQEPRRLARRYLMHGLPFAGRLLVSSALRGVRSPREVSRNGARTNSER